MVKRQAKLPFAPPRSSHTSAGGARKKSVVNCMPNVRNLVTKEKVDKFFQHPDERRRLKALALANEEPEAEWDDGELFEENNAQHAGSSSSSSSSYSVGGPGERRHGRSIASSAPRAFRSLPKSSRVWSEDRLGAERIESKAGLESKAAKRPSARAQDDGPRKSRDRASRSDSAAPSRKTTAAALPPAPAPSKPRGKRRRRTSRVPSSSDESDAEQADQSVAGGRTGANGEVLSVLDGDALGVVVTMVPAPSAGMASSTGFVSAVTPAPTAPCLAAVPSVPAPSGPAAPISAAAAPGVEPLAAASNQPPALPKRMSFGARMRSAYEDSSSDEEEMPTSNSATASDSASTTRVTSANARDGGGGGGGGSGRGGNGGRASVPGSDDFVLEVSRSARSQGSAGVRGTKARKKAPVSRAEGGWGREKGSQDTWSHYEAQNGRRFRPFTSDGAEARQSQGPAKQSESGCYYSETAQGERERFEERRR